MFVWSREADDSQRFTFRTTQTCTIVYITQAILTSNSNVNFENTQKSIQLQLIYLEYNDTKNIHQPLNSFVSINAKLWLTWISLKL